MPKISVFIIYKNIFEELKSEITNSEYFVNEYKHATSSDGTSYYNSALNQYGKFLNWLTYEHLKNKFDELKQLGQIEFVTFHQSYSYEEFVEGIKPDLKTNDLKYELKEGIFKQLCNYAKEIEEIKTEYNFDFDNISIYKILIPDNNLFEYCIEQDCIAINWGDDIDFTDCKSEQDITNKIPQEHNHRKQCISQLNLFKLWIDKDIEEGKDVIIVVPGSMTSIKGIAKITGDYYFNNEIENGAQQRPVEWLKKNINISSENIYYAKFTPPTITGMYKEKINKEAFLNLINNKYSANNQNAVLIIDEINRGNISKIFGELITLIEEDKRESLSLKLPYSQDPFTVPKNLYIIGTMNTSDRSIASIDIALRRRFTFKEMMPDSTLIDEKLGIQDLNIQDIFKTLNERISVLLDRDHQIGHSYFMNLKADKDLETNFKQIWFDCIMPLLNEYFYGDWDKLQALLGKAQDNGESFIKKLSQVKFATSYTCDEDETFDFTPQKDIDFSKALKNAFETKKDEQEEK